MVNTLFSNPCSIAFTEKYPVAKAMYNNYETLNPKLEEAIRKQGDKINYKSNVKAQMTEWRMFNEPGGEHFKEIISDSLYKESRHRISETIHHRIVCVQPHICIKQTNR